MPSPLHVVRAGVGPRMLLIHGSAVDHTTWSSQLNSALCGRFTLIAYDRRADAPTVEAHADDAAALLAEDRDPALVVGGSFGAVIALDLIRRYGERCAGAVLIEPPLPASDAMAGAYVEFLSHLDRLAEARGGPAAAERFLRVVLGDLMFDRMPIAYQGLLAARWAQIRADSAALNAYRPRYPDLANMTVPVLLVGGGRSAPYFRPTLDVLLGVLPDARLEIVADAGHLVAAEAHRKFAELVTAFARDVGLR